jgi:O-antigen/teichoic acid export membrane protein
MKTKPTPIYPALREPLKERMKKNSITNILFFVLTFPLVFIITPMILKYTGKEAYGIWAITGTILVFLEFIGLQSPNALIIAVPKYDPEKQPEEINRLANTLFVFYLAVSAIVIFVFFMMEPFIISAFFKVGTELVTLAASVLTISIILYLFNFIMLSFAYVLTGFNIYYPGNILHIVMGYLRVGLTVLALVKGFGIMGVAVVQLGSIIVETVILIAWLKFVFPPLKFDPSMFSMEKLIAMLKVSVRIMFTRLASAVNYNIDKLVLGYFLNPVTVVYYQLGATVSKYITTIPDMISSGSLMPAASELKHKNQPEKLHNLFNRVNKYIFMVSIFLMAGIIIFGKEFITLWLGAGYDDAYLVMVFLSAAYTYSLLGVPATQILNGLEKLNAPMVASFISAGINIVLSVILSRFYGLKGALIGTSISIAIGSTIMFVVFFRATKIGLNVWEVFIKPLISGLLAYVAAYYIFSYAIVPQRWPGFVIKAGVFSMIFWLIDIFIMKHLDAYDMDLLREYMPWTKKRA